MLRSPVCLLALASCLLWVQSGWAQNAGKADSMEHRPMPEAVASFGAAVESDYLYVFSGHAGTTHKYGKDKLSNHFRRIRFDDPQADWEELPTQEPAQSAALVSDGKFIYRIGGLCFDSTTEEPTVYRSTSHFARFDPATKQWTKLSDLPQPRSSHDAAVLGRSIYVVGGWSLQGMDTSDAPWYKDMLRFDLDKPESGWQSMPGPGYETRGLSVAAHAGKLYVLGGMYDDIMRDVSIFDPKDNKWSKGPEMVGDSDAAGFGTSSFAVGGKLYYSGDSGEVYRLSADGKSWEKAVKLKTPRMFLRLLAVGNDRLIAVGGTQNSRTRTATVESIRVQAPAAAPLDLGSVSERHEMVPMRDGVRLSTYLYMPAGDGPWPVIYEQRYADIRGAGSRKAFAKLAEKGYVIAAQNFRGTHQSEGTWVGYRALGWQEKQRDGYDTVEWLAAQKWSTGKIGTMGGSQAGYAQNFLAVTQPPHLVAQYMTDTGLSLYQEGYRIGGTTRPERFKLMDAVCRDPLDNRRLMEEWFAHPTYDDYWRQEDCSLHFDKMNVPCFTLGSWFDFMNIGSIESYIGRQHNAGTNSRGHQQLLIGPWLHGGPKDNKVGDVAYPENAIHDREGHLIRWFDHYLKGIENGADKDPAVRYYVMGATGEPGAPGNVWRNADDWPITANVNETGYYLHADTSLSQVRPVLTSGNVRFKADPYNPCEIAGRAFPGAKDTTSFDRQAEVRTFTSEVLSEPVEWLGKVKAEMFLSSTAKDTDVIVRVSDVYPDGRSILLVDYVRRLRYRDGYEQEVMMKRGETYKVAFDVGWLSQIFNRGHRIRVTVASTGAPFYEPNPNTGKPFTIDFPSDAVVAENTLYLNSENASRIMAPVCSARP